MKKMKAFFAISLVLSSILTGAKTPFYNLNESVETQLTDSVPFISTKALHQKIFDKDKGMFYPVQHLYALLAGDDAVALQWDMNPPQGQWIQWCSDNNDTQVGLQDGGTFYAVAHWLPNQLPGLENPAINYIAFFPTSDLDATYTLKVYQGENAGSLLLSYPVPNYIAELWNEYSIEPPLPIDLSQELWVGYEVTHVAGDIPAGCDEGPAVAGFGDLVSMDGQTWETLSSFGLDYNWNIKVSIISLEENETSEGERISFKSVNDDKSAFSEINQPLTKYTPLNLIGFNVYRDDILIAQLPLQLDYLDAGLSTGTYIYTVRAVYVGGYADPSPLAQIYLPGISLAQISFDPEELIEYHNFPMVTSKTLLVTNTGDEVLNFNIAVEYNSDIEENGKSLCVDNLYSSGCGSGDGIVSWECANIEIPTIPCAGSPPWYQNFTNMYHDFTPGQPYLITVKAGYSQTYFDVWIDWDDNSILNNSNELMVNDGYCAQANVPYNFVLMIPDDLPVGVYTMRIRTNWQNFVTDPCETYTYGNCVDFSVNIEGNPAYNWLSVLPSGGSIDPGATYPITVIYNSNSMPSGIYTGNLKFISNAQGSPHYVPVSLFPCIPICFVPLQNSINEDHSNPPQTTTQTLQLINACSSSVDFSIEIVSEFLDEYGDKSTQNGSEKNTWLTVEPASGTVEPGQMFVVSVIFNSSGLVSPGTYNCFIMIDNSTPYPQTVYVTLNLTGCGHHAVSNLECSYSDPETVELCWLPPVMETLRWDDGENCDGIGGPSNFLIAARWSPEQLSTYNNWWLTHFMFYPTSSEATYILKVWTGEQAGTLLHSQPVEEYIPDQWNAVMLETPVSITSGEWYWIGYEVTDLAWNYPAGADCGPAISGYGDMIQFDGQTWHSLSTTFGYDNNWNIAGVLAPGSTSKARDFIPNNYNVYRNDELIATLPATTYEFTDSLVPMDVQDYLAGAVYDECESMSDICSPAPISWIQVEPESFNFELIIGETLTDQFLIQNTGHPDALMDFELEINYIFPELEPSNGQRQEWLAVTPTSGQVAGQSAETIELTINTANLMEGFHYATVNIVSNAQNTQYFIVHVFLDVITSVDETFKMGIQIYPNPTKGDFTIYGSKLITKIWIFNSLGEELFNQEAVLPATFDLTKNPSGIYLLLIQNELGRVYQKVMKY